MKTVAGMIPPFWPNRSRLDTPKFR
jgi:hypothetical protein